jgi:carnosine synthase
VVLMEYVGGIGIEVEIVIFDGRHVAAFLSDNAETVKPGFNEVGCSMPSRLSR